MAERKHSRREERFLRWLDDIDRDLVWLRSHALELLSADSLAAGRDGYPASSGGPEGRGKGDHSDSVLDAVTAIVDGKPVADPVRENAANLMNNARMAARWIGNAKGSVLHFQALQRVDLRHSNAPVQCLSCGRWVACTTEDPNRGGRCQACAAALARWLEKGNSTDDPAADRLRFDAWRRAQLEGDDIDAA